MREEKVFRVGRLTIDGDIIEFHAETPLAFDAARRDQVSLGVYYDYREALPEKERTHIRITAHLDGQPAQTSEAVIGDNPVLDDSRKGFLSVPVRISGKGDLKGRFVVEASYASGPWRGEGTTQTAERREHLFTLRVTE